MDNTDTTIVIALLSGITMLLFLSAVNLLEIKKLLRSALQKPKHDQQ